MQLLGICGSLRKASFNLKLLLEAEQRLPEGVSLVHADCGDLPLYNEDLDGPIRPAPVERILAAIRSCDALLFATPEYNHSIPGVLKNTIDWVSRPAYASVLAHKPAGILSASKSFVGGARVQAHLHQVLDSTLTAVYPVPEFLVPQAADQFGEDGRLADQATAERLQRYLFGFVIWAGKHRAGLKMPPADGN